MASPRSLDLGQGIATGLALPPLAGRRDAMELGGLHHDRERVFLLSTTHGAEHAGLVRITTMPVSREEPVVAIDYGTREVAGEPSQAFRTLFLQETITRGLPTPSFVIS